MRAFSSQCFGDGSGGRAASCLPFVCVLIIWETGGALLGRVPGSSFGRIYSLDVLEVETGSTLGPFSRIIWTYNKTRSTSVFRSNLFSRHTYYRPVTS